MFIGAVSDWRNTGGDLTLDVSEIDIQEGDLLVLQVRWESSVTEPAGFTPIGFQRISVTRDTVYTKVATGSEPSSYVLTVGGRGTCALGVYRNVTVDSYQSTESTLSGIDGAGAGDTAWDTPTAPFATPPGIAVVMWSAQQAGIIAPSDGGVTVRASEGGDGASNQCITMAEIAATSPTTPAYSAVGTGTDVFARMSAAVILQEVNAPPTYTLTTNVVGSGSITLDPPGGTYDENTVVAATAVPAAGWTFTGWSGALTGTTNPQNITMDADKTITATFTEDPPDAPTGLAAVTAPAIGLSWDAVVGADSYDLERDGTVIETGLVGTSYTDTAVVFDTQYSYRLRSDTGGVKSDWTAAVSHTPTTTAAVQTEFVWDGTGWV